MLVVTMDVLLIALVVLTMLALLGRILFARNGIGFEDLLRRSDLDWPRGVQEEDSVPWHVDRLRARTRS
jgi:hypothetical protein